MKFKVGDQVLVTAGKDKGKKSTIVRVFPKSEKVVVKDVNVYVKHVKPMFDRAGERRQVERPMPLAKVAIINEKGAADRIVYKKMADGKTVRIFAKTKTEIKETEKVAPAEKKSVEKKAKKSEKKK